MAEDDRNFEPLYADQDEDVILARWRGWANEGLDPREDVDAWTDTREGSHWFIATSQPRREAARMYDLMGSEVVASAFPQHSWGEYLDDHAELRELARLSATPAAGEVTFTGEEGTAVDAGTIVGVEPATPDADAPEYETTAGGVIDVSGRLTLPIRAREAGAAGRVAARAVTALITPVEGVESVLNEEPLVGGTDTETDAALRARVLEAYVGAAVANILYYKRIALDEPGVGRATIVRAGNGPGTIVIIISTATGDPVTGDVITSLQNRLDPIPGAGAGAGQVGAEITVETAALLAVIVDALVEFEPGYSLDGAGGTVPLEEVIAAALTAYVETVEPGQEVVLQRVAATIMGIQGVHDVGGVRLNGDTRNVAVPASPPQAPSLTAVNLTEADV